MPGEIDAEALFREHHVPLYRYLLRLTGGDEALARDAVQHAFTRLLERRPDDHKLRAWLYRVATNAVRDWRSMERRREELVSEHRNQVPGPVPGERPDRAAEKREEVERVRAALQSLSEKERTVLLMREEGFKHREIAETVGTTTGSVGTMFARALDRLARTLDLDRETS